MITPKGIHRLSFVASFAIHLILFLIPMKHVYLTSSPSNTVQPIPIEFIIKETIVAKPKPIPKNNAPIKQKPLPGDRSSAIVATSSEPYYPKDAISLGLEGDITVIATINSKGTLIQTEITQSTGHPILDTAFIKTLKDNYKFKPKRIFAVNKTDRIKISYRFQL